MDSERRSSKPDVASSSLAEAANFISGSSNGRTADFESVDRGSTPLPEANFLQFSGRSADDYTGLFWKQVFAGLNPAAQTKLNFRFQILGSRLNLKSEIFHADVAQRQEALVLETR